MGSTKWDSVDGLVGPRCDVTCEMGKQLGKATISIGMFINIKRVLKLSLVFLKLIFNVF